ncbi:MULTISPECIES: dicarboxylate/amino acid:cation symporter [Sphingomonadaceae]|jgi:Na+/H+-dicarboxylate symporter|uniref:Dicarboxylate/amino acid:cation symporter n=2 Tax=Sphingobium TaxID=165695 RepID=A0ABS8H731_9SPHN|nr:MULTISPECIES: dicarboxylate/amino acid:cation symporter [Sphingomonadaceae]MEE2740749.1 dicarboxylate/amino acid:cation symporter [Pseudomonadota bacterium]HAF80865.1 dicarboxylate/amino acid:cation symporter [Brevundimonas sp.]EAT09740.1 sodium:dicarboxylate symporter [Sphingomonas sp. SKA58]MAP45909.1 dicarboxylate/amino acid:cation symporter [Sphingobium sp.]MBS47674.1 dicarboxylate/amino acid:cation symporter [Sphingobium sp.]|tara:strand:- start:2067 stop:3398 length:1332 start_codon:yes stop_codon:yes gene_type:complete
MRNRLTAFILIGMVAGVLTGYVANLWVGGDEATAKDVAGYFHLLADIFLHLIKMIIAPLVFSTLVAGIAHMGDSAALGRIGGRALAWFIIASLISLTLGLILVNFFQPGAGLNLVRSGVDSGVSTEGLNFRDFVLHIFPTSMIGAMAENSILQIVVFSLFVGVALTAIGEKGKPIVTVIEAMVELMLQVTGYVMRVAPLAVFGALASSITVQGLGVLQTYGELVGEFYIAIFCLWGLLFLAGSLFLGKRMIKLVRYVREPILIAFSTASSEAAYPKMLEQLDRFGVPRRIYSFVLPLGYSFNLDGSMMYATFATIFIAQAYGIDLPITTQITILLVLMVTSKGIAAVPRASLVVVAATLGQFDLPVEGIAFILAVDHFMDMGRTATNVLGNAIATSVITKWEGMLEVEEPEDVPHPKAPAHTSADGRRGLELASDMVEDPRKG